MHAVHYYITYAQGRTSQAMLRAQSNHPSIAGTTSVQSPALWDTCACMLPRSTLLLPRTLPANLARVEREHTWPLSHSWHTSVSLGASPLLSSRLLWTDGKMHRASLSCDHSCATLKPCFTATRAANRQGGTDIHRHSHSCSCSSPCVLNPVASSPSTASRTMRSPSHA